VPWKTFKLFQRSIKLAKFCLQLFLGVKVRLTQGKCRKIMKTIAKKRIYFYEE